MRQMICIAATGAALYLSACMHETTLQYGQDTSHRTGTEGVFDRFPIIEDHPVLPELRDEDVGAAPIRYYGFDGERLHVGPDVAPRYLLAIYNTPGLYHGTRHEHTDSGQIIAYLETMAEEGFRTFSEAPTVHIGQDDGHRQRVLRAVQWINEALPVNWHIQIGEDVAALSTTVSDGAIYMDIGEVADFGSRLPAGAAGVAHIYNEGDSRRAGHVLIALDNVGWYDPSDDVLLEKVIIHEILHVMGFGAHVDRQDSRLFKSTLGRWDSTTMLFPIDRQALFAAYARLAPGDTLEAIEEKLFNAWSTLADHYVRKTEFADFGVSRQSLSASNGPAMVQAWASGETPHVDLAHGTLSGNVIWNGELIGVRPEKLPPHRTEQGGYTGYDYSLVFGDAQVALDLSTLEGSVLFDRLRAGGQYGDGEVSQTWGDGDLEYDIEARGNTFHQTGGDDGIVTGIFVGPEHEGTAGTLERSDLEAAFGATRNLSTDGEESQLGAPKATLESMGSFSVTGTSSFRVVNAGDRFPGYFFGSRSIHSFNDWGLWAKQGGETLFKTFIGDAPPSDNLFDFLNREDYLLRVEGTPSDSNPTTGEAVWTGRVQAYDAHPRAFGTPVVGNARLEVDLTGAIIDVEFTGFTGGHADMSWHNLTLDGGVFGHRNGYDTIEGQFYGDNHQGVAGEFSRDRLDGVFGASR